MDYLDILYKCTQNDRKAQTEFYNRYVSILGNTCLRYSSCREDAQDILQKSFVKIFKNLTEKFESENHLKRWMKRIVINTAINHQRNRNIYEGHVLNGHHQMMDQDSKLNIDDETLLSNLKKLPHKDQQIINLIVVDEYSHKEAAEFLSIQEGSSRGRYSRAINKLREK